MNNKKIAAIVAVLILAFVTNVVSSYAEAQLGGSVDIVVEEPLKYVVTKAIDSTRYYNYKPYIIVDVWLQNTDTESGEFAVKIELISEGKTNVQSLKYVILPGTIKRFYYEFELPHDGAKYSYHYEVSPSTKPISGQYSLYVNDARTINGKKVTLKNVGSATANPPVIVDVDGVIETVTGTEIVNGIEVKVLKTYYSDNLNERYAVLSLRYIGQVYAVTKDLVITKVEFSPQNPKEREFVTAEIEIQNLGTDTISGQNVYISSEKDNLGVGFGQKRIGQDVPPKDTIAVSFGLTNSVQLKAGTHKIKFKVDATNNIAETNENNNEYETTLVIDQKYPIIQVYGYTFYELPDGTFSTNIIVNEKQVPIAFRLDPRQADKIYLEVSATQKVLGAQKVYIAFDPNQPDLSYFSIASAEISRILSLYTIQTVGAFLKDSNPVNAAVPIRTCSDATMNLPVIVLALSNKNAIELSNNCITVRGKTTSDLIFAADRLGLDIVGIKIPNSSNQPPTPPFKDLTITNVEFSPASLTEGESVTAQATIKNVGTEKITEDFDLYLDDGDGSLMFYKTIRGAASPNTMIIPISLGTYSAGTHKLRLAVDVRDVVDEINENNNNYEITLTVKPKQQTPSLPPTDAVQTTINLNKGWNLVSLPGELTEFTKLEGKPKAYLYVDGKFLSIKKAISVLGNNFPKYFAQNAFFVHSADSGKIIAQVMQDNSNQVALSSGWNLAPIRMFMVDKRLKEFAGSCMLSGAYFWSGAEQNWQFVDNTQKIIADYSEGGFAIYVPSNCILSEGTAPLPEDRPQLPVNPPSENKQVLTAANLKNLIQNSKLFGLLPSGPAFSLDVKDEFGTWLTGFTIYKSSSNLIVEDGIRQNYDFRLSLTENAVPELLSTNDICVTLQNLKNNGALILGDIKKSGWDLLPWKSVNDNCVRVQ